DARAGFAGLNDVIDVASLGGHKGIGETLLELGDLFLAGSVRIGGGGELAPIYDVDGSLRSHHGDLRAGPRQVDVGTDVFGAHYAIGAAVGLSRDHGNLRNRGFSVRVEELGAVTDNPAEFLLRAGKKARDV